MRNRFANFAMFIVILLIALPGYALEDQRSPRFQDYPVLEKYKGKNARLILSHNDRKYRTRLMIASKQKPNFAGHYILTAWGCGMECRMGAVIDARTGNVIWFPFTICCWGSGVPENFEPIEFRLDSNLIVVNGARNEKEGDNGKHFYKFEKNHFVQIQ